MPVTSHKFEGLSGDHRDNLTVLQKALRELDGTQRNYLRTDLRHRKARPSESVACLKTPINEFLLMPVSVRVAAIVACSRTASP